MAVVLEVPGEVYHGHSSLAELSLDFVALGERGPKHFELVVHGTLSPMCQV
jgi:hypothetical protein